MKRDPLETWGKIMGGAKSKWLVVVAWIGLLVVLMSVFPQVNSVENYSGEDLPSHMMSIEADNIIQEQFSSDAGLPLLLVWYKQEGIELSDIEAIQKLYDKLATTPLDEQKTLPPFHQIPAQALFGSLSENGQALVTPVFFEADAEASTLEHNFETISAYMGEIVEDNPFLKESLEESGLQAKFSGPAGISVDATSLFESADFKLMVATVIIILVILLIIYRSPIMAVIPLIVVSIAFLVVSPILGWMVESGWIAKDAQAVAIMIVLLFGAGTDYCLFLITKYKDQLLVEENKYVAISQAVKKSTGAIVMSGLTVVIGLGALILADYGAFQRFAVPFSLGILITLIAVITLLPAILSILGRKAFWPFIPRTVAMAKQHAEKKNKAYVEPKENHRIMRKIGQFTTGRPWLVIAATMIVLVGLALTSTQIKYKYDLLSSFPEDIDSRQGFTIIEQNFTAGELAPVKVIVQTNNANMNITEDLQALSYVGEVADIQYGSSDATYHLYEVNLVKNPYSNEAMEDVEQLKLDMEQILIAEGMPTSSYWIGGETSKQLDTRAIQAGDESLVQPVILIIIFLVLVIYLRGLITSIQLIVTVLISFFAALGAGWLIIHGILGHDAVASAIPLYSFVFIIALGNDYNIFMISDIWKNKKAGLGHRESIVKGVSETGAVITSAGLILAGTFAVLASLPIQLLVQFGIVTAIGVLLDTFIVRPLLVPAIIQVCGKWAYWPSKLWKK